MSHGREECREGKRADHREIEKYRRTGRRCKTIVRVQRARDQALDGNQCEIGKRDPRQRNGKLEARSVKARREQAYDFRRVDERNDQERDLQHDHRKRETIREGTRGLFAVLFKRPRVSGNEGRGESAFREDRTKMVGQAEGDEECVGNGSRAEHRRHHHVAEKSGDARKKREAADREEAPDHAARLTGFSRAPRAPRRSRDPASARRDRDASAAR